VRDVSHFISLSSSRNKIILRFERAESKSLPEVLASKLSNGKRYLISSLIHASTETIIHSFANDESAGERSEQYPSPNVEFKVSLPKELEEAPELEPITHDINFPAQDEFVGVNIPKPFDSPLSRAHFSSLVGDDIEISLDKLVDSAIRLNVNEETQNRGEIGPRKETHALAEDEILPPAPNTDSGDTLIKEEDKIIENPDLIQNFHAELKSLMEFMDSDSESDFGESEDGIVSRNKELAEVLLEMLVRAFDGVETCEKINLSELMGVDKQTYNSVFSGSKLEEKIGAADQVELEKIIHRCSITVDTKKLIDQSYKDRKEIFKSMERGLVSWAEEKRASVLVSGEELSGEDSIILENIRGLPYIFNEIQEQIDDFAVDRTEYQKAVRGAETRVKELKEEELQKIMELREADEEIEKSE
jgi:hypothetical protein